MGGYKVDLQNPYYGYTPNSLSGETAAIIDTSAPYRRGVAVTFLISVHRYVQYVQ